MLPLDGFSYSELQNIYDRYFSMSYLNTDIGSKFALISLICYLTHKLKLNKPEVTCYKVIMKIIEKESHMYNETFINGLSIVCEDYLKQTSEFLTFDLKTKSEMVAKVREILKTWVPF